MLNGTKAPKPYWIKSKNIGLTVKNKLIKKAYSKLQSKIIENFDENTVKPRKNKI